ncbi:hypothetical protein AAD001_17125 [Colwelliaceae bacterium 6471]
MDLIDTYIIYFGLPYSALAGIILFYMRFKGIFSSKISRLVYFIIGTLNAALAGLAMYSVESDSYLFYCGAIIVLFYALVFNSPLQTKRATG